MSIQTTKDERLKFAEMLANLRNGLQAVVESVDAFLNYLGEMEIGEWIPQNIKWEQVEGTRGPYERADKQEGKDFQLLLKDLHDHEGAMQVGGYFYWKFERSETIGRKPISKKA